jgi:DNA ligase-1
MQNSFILILLLSILLMPSLLYAKQAFPQLALAKNFKDSFMTHPFWVSEKLDGIRCYWNGQKLLTRSGRIIHAPQWFLSDIPSTAMDGELWIKRGSYQPLSRIVLDAIPDEVLWRQVSFQVFDLPHSKAPFELRQQQLQTLISNSGATHVAWVEQKKMGSLANIKARLEEVYKNGGEGLMLTAPSSLYGVGRSNNLLKMKLRQDAEAIVIAYQEGRGKHENMMGAIWVEMSDGKLFKIGTGFTNLERQVPPPIGSEITYSYQGYTENGLPRFASYMRAKQEE